MMKHNKGNEMTPCRQQRKQSVLFEACSDFLATKRDYASFIDHQCFQISHTISRFWTHVFREGHFMHTFTELPSFALSLRSSLALGWKKASCHKEGRQVKPLQQVEQVAVESWTHIMSPWIPYQVPNRYVLWRKGKQVLLKQCSIN